MELLDMASSSTGCISIPAGTETDLYYTCECEMNGFPQTEFELNATTALGDRLKLAEAFDFSTAASGLGYWRKTKIKIGSGGLKMTVIGEVGGQSLQSAVRFIISGTELEQAAWAHMMVKASGCLVLAIKQEGSDDMRIIGTVSRPAAISSLELDGGDAPETTNQGAYEVSANTPIHYYDDTTFGMDLTPNP